MHLTCQRPSAVDCPRIRAIASVARRPCARWVSEIIQSCNITERPCNVEKAAGDAAPPDPRLDRCPNAAGMIADRHRGVGAAGRESQQGRKRRRPAMMRTDRSAAIRCPRTTRQSAMTFQVCTADRSSTQSTGRGGRNSRPFIDSTAARTRASPPQSPDSRAALFAPAGCAKVGVHRCLRNADDGLVRPQTGRSSLGNRRGALLGRARSRSPARA